MSTQPERNPQPNPSDGTEFTALFELMLERRIHTLRPESEWYTGDVFQDLSTWLLQHKISPEVTERLKLSVQNFYRSTDRNDGVVRYVGVAAIPVNDYGGVYVWFEHLFPEGYTSTPQGDAVFQALTWDFMDHVSFNFKTPLTLNPSLMELPKNTSVEDITVSLRDFCNRSALQFIGLIDRSLLK